MILKPKFGIDKLLFGMKQQDVESLYGKPDFVYKDEEKNIIWMYNNLKMRLTFYEEEEFKLGYLVTTNANLILFDEKIINISPSKIVDLLEAKGFKSWETTTEDGFENHFNEDNWLMLISEYGEIVKVEVGAVFNNQDEFDWKFKA
ncbi:hypothetical protein [Flavobacterium sp.]|uniref:hypothetical protein n=1 Tax=Flavobacterium sp. TaxID=239 RepID=UPI0028BDE19E|nr:hypothetical protein [Flavobacterium sp.]